MRRILSMVAGLAVIHTDRVRHWDEKRAVEEDDDR